MRLQTDANHKRGMAVGVAEARRTAQEERPIVILGRIGAIAKPIAKSCAMFLVTDLGMELCKDGCAAPLQSSAGAGPGRHCDGPGRRSRGVL